jgi:superfamily II DNA or RNA helicase
VWSRGVKLARSGAVTGETADASEAVLRVAAPGRAVALTVTLYLRDQEWDCDCPGPVDPCEHVAAAAIALAQAAQEGQALPEPRRRSARVRYQFLREGSGLRLKRWLSSGDGELQPLEGTLSALVSRRVSGPAVSPEEYDLRADQLLSTRSAGVLPWDKLRGLVKVLAGATEVYLEDRHVQVSEEEILPQARVEDDGPGLLLRITANPRVSQVLPGGLVLCGDTLHLLGETDLTGFRLERLPHLQQFAPSALGELSTRVLPALRKRIPVEVATTRLPGVQRGERPRLLIDLGHRGHALSVLPTLVYGDPVRARIDGGRLVHLGGAVPVRDEDAEQRLVHALRDQLNLLPGRRTQFEGAEAARFLERLATFQAEVVGDAAPDLRRRAELIPRLELHSRPVTGQSLPETSFALQFEVRREGDAGSDAGPATVPAAAVLRAWRDGLGLVPLGDGGFAPLPVDWLERHGHLLRELLAAQDDAQVLAPHALPQLASLCDALEQPAPPALAQLKPLFEQFDALPPAALPGDLTATLRPYQRRGVDWLAFLRDAGLGAVLADDMGLGKTLQALAAVATPALVVAPTSVMYNWAQEVARFRPGLRTCLYHGARRAIDDGADIVITSYALLRLDVERLTGRTWNTVILDEAQAIKNPESQAAQAAFQLRAGFRVAMSGTPVENRLDELWSLMHFANPGMLGGRSDFRTFTAGPIESGDEAARARLRQRIAPFLLRRRKREVAPELPPRSEAVLRVELDERERSIYDAVRAATRADLVRILAEGGNVMAALEALLRLRQAACHPALVPGQTAAGSSKIERLLAALDTAAADDHKALVFSQWTSFLDLLEPHLVGAGLPFCRLDGATRDRAAVVESFQDPAGPPVMLVSLKAGGTGLNLTRADHIFLLDPWWNPAVEDQAADRAHRIGQERPVFVYRLVAQDTVDERILELQQRKRNLVDVALGEADRAAQLTRDDLLALLG